MNEVILDPNDLYTDLQGQKGSHVLPVVTGKELKDVGSGGGERQCSKRL